MRLGRRPQHLVARALTVALATCLVSCGSRSVDPGVASASSALTSGPAFVQVAYATPQSGQSTVSVKYTVAQSAGDTNVVVVGWDDTVAAVTAVTDTLGNVYALAVGPTTYPGALTQSIYYAKNIAAAAAGANSVKVVFNGAAAYVDMRIVEYSGLDPVNPVDVVAGASGSADTADSGAATTTNANDLLFGADYTTGNTSAAGAGFTSRTITFPDSDIAEDRVVTVAGSYHATAPIGGGLWVMQMVAFRAAPTDTQPPTAPASLAATAASSARIDLNWTASTDNLGVAGYLIERCQGVNCTSFAQIAAPSGTGTTFSDSGRAPGTSYSYRVRAKDGVGNLGPYSPVASATTLPDTQPPTAPGGLTASATSGTTIGLSWTASTDDVGVTGYLIERCQGPSCVSFAQIAAPVGAGTSYADSGLTAGTSYSYRVRATDAAGNLGAYSGLATAVTPAPDTQAPTAPSGLTASAVNNAQINLSWTAATDNVGVTGYLIERCQGATCTTFAQIAAPPGTGTVYSDIGLLTGTSYGYQVRARDAAGNLGGYSNTATATTLNTVGVPATPTFVQGNYATPQSSKTSVPINFTGAQRAGDFNVVVVGWNDTSARVTSVTDTKLNTYRLAVGPTQAIGSLSIYYATNIAGASAGANTVTVGFSPAAAYADIRILEYSGIDHGNPLDVAIGASGTSTSCNSGSVLTTNASDLLVGANMVQNFTTAAGAGFNLRFITQPDGDLVEDRVVSAIGSYAATAQQATADGWLMQLAAFKAAPPDFTPPNVTVTSPNGGASLTGTVNVTVTADDPDSGLQSIQLLVDGAAVELIALTSPATFSLDTSKFPNGVHAVGASALNGVRTTGYAAPVNVTFSNPSAGNPAVSGLWAGPVTLPLVPVHVSQLPGARILMSDGQSLGTEAWTWDTATNAFTYVPVPANIFCSGHEQMADGRIFVTGGHNGGAHLGLTVNNAFDPVTSTWTALPNMTYPRWYPTATTLADGRELVLSGESNCPDCDVLIPEIYSPTGNTWTKLTSASLKFPYYPQVFTLPDGRVVVAATTEAPIVSQVLNVGAQTWTPVGGPAVEGGSAAMYRTSKLIKVGTAVDPDATAVPSSNIASVLDMTQATPTWRQVAGMAFPRTYVTLTLLPDGTVLATGGGPTTAPLDTTHAIKQAEVWNPATETWATLASMKQPRLYHSSALLLPDARVLVLGGGRFDDQTVPTDQFNAEIFSPPYLFKGPRPVITSAPATLQLGQAFSVGTPDASRITSVVMMRYASVTHSINMAQRYIPLTFSNAGSSLTVTAPANYNLATPGNYLLFLVDSNGIPSVAATVRL